MQQKRFPQNRPMIKYGVRASLRGRVLVCFAACAIPAALSWALQLFPVDIGVINLLVTDTLILQIPALTYILSFVASVLVTDPMRVRLAGFFLALGRGAEKLPSPLSVCDCFGTGYFRLVKGMFLKNLRVTLCTVVPICVGALLPGSLSWQEVSGLQVLQFGGAFPLFAALGGLLGLYVELVYTMVPYVLFDESHLSAADALRKARALTRGRVWELLVLQLSFFGWLMAISVSFFLAAVYVYPYLEGTMAAYYLAYATPPDRPEDTLRAA